MKESFWEPCGRAPVGSPRQGDGEHRLRYHLAVRPRGIRVTRQQQHACSAASGPAKSQRSTTPWSPTEPRPPEPGLPLASGFTNPEVCRRARTPGRGVPVWAGQLPKQQPSQHSPVGDDAEAPQPGCGTGVVCADGGAMWQRSGCSRTGVALVCVFVSGSVRLLGALSRVLDLSAWKLCNQRGRCYASDRRPRP